MNEKETNDEKTIIIKNNIQSAYQKRNQGIINQTAFRQLQIQHLEQDPINPRGRPHEH